MCSDEKNPQAENPTPEATFTPIDRNVAYPVEWWRCMRRGPVSGRYNGKNSAGNRILDLRVDIDPIGANSQVMERISGDFYQFFNFNWFGRNYQWQTYQNSWIVDRPQLRWKSCSVTITGRVRFWKGSQPTTDLSITIPWGTFSPAGPATATFTSSGSSESFNCPRASDFFRSVELEVDVAARVNAAPLLPTYNTHGHNTRPSGIAQRDLDMTAAYREAGIEMTVNSNTTVIDDSNSSFNSWSVAELHDAMETSFSRYAGSWPNWKVWGLLAGRYVNSGTGGIMFDYSGAQEPPQRQGFAVFRDHSWFNNLNNSPSNQAQQWAMRHFLYTWVHEAGHAFNFVHSWDKSRPDALSWMNYDWKYDARNGSNSFWNNFAFRFDDEELLHIRHGDRSSVIMGGDDWSSGLHLDAPAELHTDSHGDFPLELMIRSQGFFELLEPVSVELRLRNLVSDLSIGIDARLQPDFGNVKIVIQKPDGRIIDFHPPMCQVGSVEEKELAPLGKKGPDRHAEMIDLNFSNKGFIFDAPGTYKIRAVYRAMGDAMIVSNLHQIRIGYPESKEVDRLAQDFFDTQVGLFLTFGGSRSEHLQKGMAVIEQVCEQFADSNRGLKAAVSVARTLSEVFFTLNEKSKLVAKKPTVKDHDLALKLTSTALKFYQQLTSGDRAHNFAYSELAEVRLRSLADKGNLEQAEKEKSSLLKHLKARSVKLPILKLIDERLKLG